MLCRLGKSMRNPIWLALALLAGLAAPILATAQEAVLHPRLRGLRHRGTRDYASLWRAARPLPPARDCSSRASNSALHVFRGVAYSNAGDQQRAIEDLSKALALDPGTPARGITARSTTAAWRI